MIDCGVSFSKMKEELYKCDTLLITHTHSDHVKPETLNKIRKTFPNIKVYGNYDVAYQYKVDKIIGSTEFKLPKHIHTLIIPHEGTHDVPVTYFVIKFDKVNVIYATDTNKIENPLGLKFDYLFIESNHDEEKLRQIGKQFKRKGYDPFANARRHLSTQKCMAFYYMNRRDKDSVLEEMHKSSRFY